DGGQNRIIAALGANEHLNPAHILAQRATLSRAAVLLTQMENNLDATVQALTCARQHRLRSVLNPAPVHADVSATVLQSADVLTPNEGEFAQLAARFANARLAPAAVAGMDDAVLHALARKLTGGSVIITLGAHGVFVSHGNTRHGDAKTHY